MRRYCTFFLRNIACNNPSCLYLHDLAKVQDCYTKEDLSATDRFGVPLTQSYQFGLSNPSATASSRVSSDSEDDSPSTSLPTSLASLPPLTQTRSVTVTPSKSAIVVPTLTRAVSAPVPGLESQLSEGSLLRQPVGSFMSETRLAPALANRSTVSENKAAENKTEFLGIGLSLNDLRDPLSAVPLANELKWDFQKFVDEFEVNASKTETIRHKSRYMFANAAVSNGQAQAGTQMPGAGRSQRQKNARSRNNSERL